MPMYNFVIDCTDADLEDYLNMPPQDAVKVFTRGDLNWCLQTYFILSRQNKIALKCTNTLCDDSINIVHSDQLLKLKGNPSQFLVCVRADYPKRRWAHYHIVQNQKQLGSDTSYVPHWVQPGLIKRDENRQGVKRVAYAGEILNGNLAGSVKTWEDLFSPHDIEFVTLAGGSWHDLKDIDVLIGIRSFNSQTYDSKPPTKLFSAWHANIPFIGGHDSAFLQVGTPGIDYLLASTPEEAVNAVLKLRDNKDLYISLIENSKEKVEKYNENSIAKEWLEILSRTIIDRYELWKARPTDESKKFILHQRLGLAEHEVKKAIKSVLKF